MGAPPRHPLRPPPSDEEIGRWRRVVRLAGAATALWVLSLLSIVLVAVRDRDDPMAAAGWLVQLVLTVAGTVLLWRWWGRIYDRRPSDRNRPPELDTSVSHHVGLDGDVQPPTRW